jgi:hypothetical protein
MDDTNQISYLLQTQMGYMTAPVQIAPSTEFNQAQQYNSIANRQGEGEKDDQHLVEVGVIRLPAPLR